MRLRNMGYAGQGIGAVGYSAAVVARQAPSQFYNASAWAACSATSAAPFSAVGYFFGKEIRNALDVPVGLINMSVGGSPAEAWMRRAVIPPARIPNLAGIKFTNPDLMAYLQCLRAGDWDIPWGIDEWMLGALATGARGAVGSSFNFAAPLYHGLIAAFEKGDLAAARDAQHRSTQLIAMLARHGYMGAAKLPSR